jgi:hypothetical protein
MNRDLKGVRPMRRICVLPLVLLATLGLSRLRADEGPAAEPASSPGIIEEFGIRRDGSEFLIAPVKVADENFSAVIDTGCTCSVVDTSLRRLVGRARGQIDVGTPNGTRRFQFFDGPEFELGSQPVKVKPEQVGCHDLAPFRRLSKQNFHVIVGMDVLKRFALRLDFPQAKATIFEQAPPTTCAATELKRFSEIPCVVGRFGQTASWLMIDTGSVGGDEGSLSRGAFDRLRGQGSLTVTGRVLSVSAGGQAVQRSGRLNSLLIANRLYTAADVSESRSCALGLAHLSRYVVTLDFPNNVAYFDVPAHVKNAGPLGSLGMVTTWQDGKLVVTAAATDGRAARSGVRVGDQILAVDGVTLNEDSPPAPPRPSATQRHVVLSIDRGRSRYNLSVAPTYLAVKSVKSPANATASNSASPTRPASSNTSSVSRLRIQQAGLLIY